MPEKLHVSIGGSLLTLLLCCLVTPELVCGQSPQPVVPSASPVYVDVAQSRNYVLVGKSGLGHDHGVEGKFKGGTLALNSPQNAGKLEFDIASFTADTAAARKYVGLSGETDAATAGKVTKNMQSPDVLDVKRFPTAIYVVKSALPAPRQTVPNKTQFVLDGEFTLHGVTRALQLVAEAEPQENGVRVRTKFSILQSDFGITPFTQAFGVVGVADRLEIWGDLTLTSQPPETAQQRNAPRR